MHKIVVFDYRITPVFQKQINALSSEEVTFPAAVCPEADFVAKTGGADIVLVSPWDHVTKAYLEACPSIRYLGLCGTSTANIDLAELKKRNIAFSNIVLHQKESVAEFYFMQLVNLARGLGAYQWKPEPCELKGKRIGIVGLGAVGQAMAHLALAYKMHVSYFSPHRKPAWENLGLEYLEMAELLPSSDIVVVCSPTNVVVLREAEFHAMRPGTILVQASGGTPFDKPAFFKWIQRGDTFAIFELSAGEANYQAYKELPNVIFPHVTAGDTYEANERRSARAVENLTEYLAQAES